MAAAGALVVYRAVFAALGCLMVGTLVYTCITDGSPFRIELLTPWIVTTLVDFYVNIAAISTWVVYKEGNWISSIFWVVLLICFGSATTCAYIVSKLFEITSSGLSQNPLDLLLLRQDNLPERKCSFVVIGRTIFSILGILMAALVTYTVITDGLPFRKDLLTPWMAATLIDFYINVFAISVWVVHRESTWISAVIWICLLICFGRSLFCASLSALSPICSILPPTFLLLYLHHNMWLHCGSTSPSVVPRPSLPSATELP
ncbi:uncharacterized protein LOC123412027 isoform X1 [Hordeum vulgare subsp. vulgare]|uniref:uncharacterized protein LOC123412027 isoform X1 n=1 Tax=Hordeum vulgare subsp. vulgare TaxID=112509 RepID=UPI001D1A4B0C|nr:uncharacterized protein LOC123412027 isoform X1 [Hordeum vulgare subsp. vulgare]XP_044960919.1 uncharacterized protein LOC123412027 isoform X1 [Hordeum vulgare subsp. vulgare]XP_044960920.1 uncharacterized protein LOC123412027 isoform X1 [Hordeum vulgare subsp. vulgare]